MVHRTDEAADCPDAAALAALVADQMKRPALAPAEASDRGLDVQIYRSDKGYTAVVQADGKTRRISDAGPSCGGLAAALSVSIAVMLDSEPLLPEPEPAPRPVESPAPPPPRQVVSPPAERCPVEERSFHADLALEPALTGGLLDGFAAGVTADLELRFGRFSVGGGVLALPSQTIVYEGGTVNLSLTTGLLRLCATPFGDAARRVALCAEPYAGMIRGFGQGYRVDRTSSRPWAALGASALFTQRLVGPLSLGVRGWLVIPVQKQSFLVDNVGTAFAPAPVGGALSVGIRVSIW